MTYNRMQMLSDGRHKCVCVTCDKVYDTISLNIWCNYTAHIHTQLVHTCVYLVECA